MKKFKTYGKYKTATHIKSDEWDEIKEFKAESRFVRKFDDSYSKENQQKESDENVFSPNNSESSMHKTQPLHDVTDLFDNLSLDNHSTPLVSDVKGPKSSSGTPLKYKSIEHKERLSSSEHNFTCKRFVSFSSNSKKIFEKRRIGSSTLISNNSIADASSNQSVCLRKVSFKEALSNSTTFSEAEKKILNLCDQEEILSLESVVDETIVRKIGEGSYGEVYLKEEDGFTTALKIVPVGNLSDQMKFDDVLPEIAISKKLSNWKLLEAGKELYPENYVEGFIELKSLCFCKGPFTRHLKQLWEEWKEDKGNDCQNEHPDIYDVDQKYVVFENKFGGQDLEKVKISTVKEAISILKQLVASIASAECSIQLEHRDLHWGNILINKVDKKKNLYILVEENEYEIASCGLTVAIIDFTLARLLSEECVVFTDLSSEEILFQGQGDPQFDVYREMKKHNGNEWESFNPYTNVLWIHYVTNKLVSKLRKHVTVKKFASRVLEYNSCYEILMEDELFG